MITMFEVGRYIVSFLLLIGMRSLLVASLQLLVRHLATSSFLLTVKHDEDLVVKVVSRC